MSDNWIVQNLENALKTWNDKLSEIWMTISMDYARQLNSVLIDLGDAEVADSKFKLEVTSDGTNWQAVDLSVMSFMVASFNKVSPAFSFLKKEKVSPALCSSAA